MLSWRYLTSVCAETREEEMTRGGVKKGTEKIIPILTSS
jgi:hypothetical protein